MNDDRKYRQVEIRVGAITYKIRTYESDSYVWNISKIIDTYLDRINRENKSIKGNDAIALALINSIDYSYRLKNAMNDREKYVMSCENEIKILHEKLELSQADVKEAREVAERAKRDLDNAERKAGEIRRLYICEQKENDMLEKSVEALKQELADEKEKNERLEAQRRSAKIQEVKSKKNIPGRYRGDLQMGKKMLPDLVALTEDSKSAENGNYFIIPDTEGK